MLLVMVLCGRSGDEWLLQSCCSPNLQNTTYESNWLERKYQKMDEHGILRYITIYYTLRMLLLWVYCAKVYCYHRCVDGCKAEATPLGSSIWLKLNWCQLFQPHATGLLPFFLRLTLVQESHRGSLVVYGLGALGIWHSNKEIKTLISTTLKSTTVRHAFVSKYKTLRRHHHVFSIQMTTKPSFWLLVHLQ